jgi:4-amino-4-deoxy-L-arabinose transferase-like glycosyltransferase
MARSSSASGSSAAPWRRAVWAVALLGVLLTWAATWHRTPTSDEPRHLQMGRQVIEQHDWSRFDNSKMPVSALNALPTLISGAPRDEGPEITHRDWFWPRLPQALWLLGAVLIAGRWAERLWGARAGFVAAAFVALDPNLQAHAGLVTTDAPIVFFVLACGYTAWLAVEQGRWSRWLIAGACFGAAQAAKFTAAFLVPILGLAIPAALLWHRLRSGRWNGGPLRLLGYALAAWLVLNLGYGFQGSFTPASEIAWRSNMMAPLAELSVPLPVPRPWVEGLDWVRSDDEHGSGNIYADGEFTTEGQADHYLRAATRKFSLPLLALGALGLLWPRRRGREDLFLTWPALFLVGWFSLNFNFQIGTRYLLPVIPLLAVVAARLPWQVGLVGALLAGISGLSWYPHGLCYQNERLLDRAQAWRHVADSDLDWDQHRLEAQSWLAEHPGGVADADVPALGPMLVGANRLVGVWGDPSRFACLRDRFPPVEHLSYSWYPYDLSADALEACFPRQAYQPGDGTWRFEHDGGPVLVTARVRGTARLTVGAGEPIEVEAEDHEQRLLGVIVDAPPGGLTVSVEGRLQGLYLDARPHPDAPFEDRG